MKRILSLFVVLLFLITNTSTDLEASAYKATTHQEFQFLVAARDGDISAVRKFIYGGIDINIRYEGLTALHSGAYYGHIDVVEALINAGADLDVREDKNGTTPLHIAVHKGNTAIAKALIEAGADVNAGSKKGVTPLHTAALGNLAMAEILIGADADVDAKATGDVTPLHTAAENGHVHIVDALLRAGADRGIKVDEGFTAYDLAVDQGHTAIANILKNKRTDTSTATEGFWGGTQDKTFTESFQYGFDRGIKGDVPWYFYLFWFLLIGALVFACWKGAEKRGRNPWIWGGLTGLCILFPLICWVPYVMLRILGTSTAQKTKM